MKILLLGKDGQVGCELQRSLAPLGEVVGFGRQDADLDEHERLRQLVRQVRPEVIVNAAAYTAVDKAESEPEKTHRINAGAVAVLAEEAARLNAWLVHFSTDYVFDGTKPFPYVEDDSTNPLSVYGKTKVEGERLIQRCHAKYMIFRTSWVYSVHGHNFAKTILRLAREKDDLIVVADQHGAPTSAELIADVTSLALYRVACTTGTNAKFSGIYHLAAAGETTWYDYAQYVLGLALEKSMEFKAGATIVHPVSTEAFPLRAARPKNSRLDTTKLANTFNVHLPNWRYHVQRFMNELVLKGSL